MEVFSFFFFSFPNYPGNDLYLQNIREIIKDCAKLIQKNRERKIEDDLEI